MLIREGDIMLDRIFDLNKIHNTINNFSDSLKEEYYNYLIFIMLLDVVCSECSLIRTQ